MSGKQGQRWDTAKIGPTTPPTPDDDHRDAGYGKGPHCAICGVPESTRNKLIPGRWGYLRWNMDLTLCERCVRYQYERGVDRRDTDPLSYEDVA